MKRALSLLLILSLLTLCATGCTPEPSEPPASETPAEKPVLYLYPQTQTAVRVQLGLDGQLTTTWPAYDGGWQITAQPDGTLQDSAGHEYPYLFWEGALDAQYDLTRGFCVPGGETGEFLRGALSELGLTAEEYTDFIVYWLPRMEQNAYNLITFQQEAYTDAARLVIEPEPDSLLRVFMAWKPLDTPMELEPQTLSPFTRTGFVAVEWGGCQLS